MNPKTISLFRRGLALTAGVSVAVLLTGCTGPGRVGGIGWTDKHGVRHALILGFGVVSVAQTNGVVVSDVRGAGLILDRGLSAGFVQSHRVEIDPAVASNAVVSIQATPLSLQVSNYDFRQTNYLGFITPTQRTSQP